MGSEARQLAGKVAIPTGGRQGVGEAIAVGCAGAGARCSSPPGPKASSTPEDIAPATIVLASDASDCVTGQAIGVEGGTTMLRDRRGRRSGAMSSSREGT